MKGDTVVLNYDIYNNGLREWVVFLHGIGGKNDTFSAQIDKFSKEYNLLLIELPWHNSSPFPYKNINPKNLSKEIKKVLDFVKIENAHFVALSLGTIVLSHFSTIYPEYIKTMTLTSSAIEVTLFLKYIIMLVYPFKWLLPYKIIYNVAVYLVAPQKKYKSIRKLYTDEFDRMNRRHIVAWVDYMIYVLFPKKTVKNMKKLFKGRVKFISGSKDTFFLKGSKRTASKITDGEIDILDGCCHVCNLDGAELYNKKVLSFIKEHNKDNKNIPIDIEREI